MTDYKPGTVAHIRIRDRYEGPAIRTNTGGWAWVPNDIEGAFCGISVTARTDDVRPLVVLDLEAAYGCWAEKRDPAVIVARLRETNSVAAQAIADQIEQQTKPPKPDEPQGLGAVVEDAHGRQWVHVERAHLPWLGSVDGSLLNVVYDEIDAVRVLSEGVRP